MSVNVVELNQSKANYKTSITAKSGGFIILSPAHSSKYSRNDDRIKRPDKTPTWYIL